MKTNIRRLLIMILCLAMLVSIFSSCGTGSSGASQETASTESVASVPTNTEESLEEPAIETLASTNIEEPVSNQSAADFQLPICDETQTISYWFEMSPQVATYLNTMNDNISYQLLEELTNVHVDFWAVTDETDQQFSLMVASGDYADIMIWGSRYYPGGAIKGVEDEVFMELTDVIKDYMPNYGALIDHPDVYGQVVMTDGRIGEIFTLNRNPSVPGVGPIVRKDWLDKLGIAPEDIVTYDDYHNMLSQFKSEFGATGALYLGPNGVPSGNYLTAGYGVAAYTDSSEDTGAYYQDNGTVYYGPIQSGFKDYLTMMNQWYQEGLISSDYLQHSDIQVTAGDVTDGSTGLWYHMSQIMSEHMASAIDANFESIAIKDAVKNAGELNRLGNYSDSIVGSNSLSISATCQNIDVVAKWVDFAFSPQGSLIYSYGVEGETYNYDDAGNPVFTDLIANNPDGLGTITACNLYAIQTGIGYLYEDRFDSTYPAAALEAGQIWMETLDLDNMMTIPAAANLSALDAEIYAEGYSNILTYVSENIAKFITGARSLDEFDDYVADIEAMGIADCIQCWQNAVDAYLAQ